MFAFFIVFASVLFGSAMLASLYAAARQWGARARCYRRQSLHSLIRSARARAIARHYLPPLLILLGVGALLFLAEGSGGGMAIASLVPIIAVRCQDARGLGWLTAKTGDILEADGWGCSSDRPHDCSSGLYGWQIHPTPRTRQEQGWPCTTDATWVAWQSADERVAELWGKVATFRAQIVREACDPIAMLAWVRAQGYEAPPPLAHAALQLTRIREAWLGRLAEAIAYEARYQSARGNGWPVSRGEVHAAYLYGGARGPVEWAYPLAQAVETGAWDADGRRVNGTDRADAEVALRKGVSVQAAFLRRMGGACLDLRPHIIRRMVAENATETAILRAAQDARERKIGRAVAIDRSGRADGPGLRTAEQGPGARSARRTIAVWYRGSIAGWITPYRAGDETRTTVARLQARAKRVQGPAGGGSGKEAEVIVKRAMRAIKRRGWQVERFRASRGGWGHSATYAYRVTDTVHGVEVARWYDVGLVVGAHEVDSGIVLTTDAALRVLDADRAMREVRA